MRTRVTICTLAGLLAVGFILFFAPKPTYTPSGIILPAQTVRAPISPDQVTIYDQVPDASVTRLGQVRVELHYKALDEQTRDALFSKIKSLAASVGANGVVINVLVHGNMVGRVITFLGTAIYTPKGSNP